MGQFESSLDEIDFEDRKGVLEYDLTIRGVCNKIKSGKIKRIVILTGAGISSSAGIPDFRSPDTGIYNTIQEYNLPEPESLFDIDFFKDDPYPFYDFMKVCFLNEDRNYF